MSEARLELRRPKGRSPSYPAISLEAAIQRVAELYEKERQHPTPTTTVARHWGYKSLNGPAAVALAALKKFGLAEDEGSGDSRRARVSDLAVDILAHPDETQRQRAVETASMRPPIHQELWERYGADLPSDASLHWELTRDRGFTETGATDFIREYKATIAFARLGVGAESSTQALTGVAANDDIRTDDVTESSQGHGGGRRTVPDSRRSFLIPLIGGGTVVVEGDFPLTERDWAQFMSVLSAMKPGLVFAAGADASQVEHKDQ